MVSSSSDDSEDEQIHLLRRELSAAQASSATRAAAVRARRNIRLGLADDSDEAMDAGAFTSRRASGAKLHGSDDCYIPLSKKRRVFEDSPDDEVMDSDDEEETNTSQASLHTPRKIKTKWREIKVCDSSKTDDEAINDGIDQIMCDSLRDTNFHTQNGEHRRPSDR